MATQPAPPAAQMTQHRKLMPDVMPAVGRLTLLAIFVQFVLAGLGIFDTAHGGAFKNSYFSVHNNFALVIEVLAVLMPVIALVSRAVRLIVGESALLALLVGRVQHALAQRGRTTRPGSASCPILLESLKLWSVRAGRRNDEAQRAGELRLGSQRAVAAAPFPRSQVSTQARSRPVG